MLNQVDPRKRRRKAIYRQRRGFTLMLTLILLATVSLLLVGVSLQSFRVAQNAVFAEDQLQARWANVSIQKYVFERAPALVSPTATPEEEEEQQSQIQKTDRQPLIVDIELGKMQFRLHFADENAKININRIQRQYGAERCTLLINHLLQSSDVSVTISPSALRDGNPTDSDAAAVSSWNELFLLDEVPREQRHKLLSKLTRKMTLWGSGEVNYLTAEPSVLDELLDLEVLRLQSRKILDILESNPELTVEQAAVQASVPQQKQLKLSQLLTDKSSCFSLRVECVSGQNNGVELYIGEFDEETQQPLTFRSYHW